MANVFMQAYVSGGDPEFNNICPKGTNFSADQIFLLVSNHALHRGERSYFEITVTSYVDNPIYNYIPISIGIHKEPTTGIFVNDYIVGSVYYNKATGEYYINESTTSNSSAIYRNPLASYKAPVKDDIIGVGFDYDQSKITLYINGHLLYEIHPTLFNLPGNDAFYPCIYCNNVNHIEGTINFGKNGNDSMSYLPPGYITTHMAHNKSILDPYVELSGIIDVKNDSYVYPVFRTPTVNEDISCEFTVDSIKGNGDTYLVTDMPAYIASNDSYYMDNSMYGSVFSNLPISRKYDIYLELYARDAIINANKLGVPLVFGLTENPNSMFMDTLGSYIKIPLYHNKNRRYLYSEKDHNGNVTTTNIDNVLTSLPIQEGKYIGILISPIKKKITVWVDKILFYEYDIHIDLTKGNYYIFLQNDRSFQNYVNGTMNLGIEEKNGKVMKSLFKMEMPENSISLWHYYNKMTKNPVSRIPDLDCVFYLDDSLIEFNKFIYGHIEIEWADNPDRDRFSAGMNLMMGTYNTISDTLPHHDEARYNNFDYLVDLVKRNNNNFYQPYPDDEFVPD